MPLELLCNDQNFIKVNVLIKKIICNVFCYICMINTKVLSICIILSAHQEDCGVKWKSNVFRNWPFVTFERRIPKILLKLAK